MSTRALYSLKSITNDTTLARYNFLSCPECITDDTTLPLCIFISSWVEEHFIAWSYRFEYKIYWLYNVFDCEVERLSAWAPLMGQCRSWVTSRTTPRLTKIASPRTVKAVYDICVHFMELAGEMHGAWSVTKTTRCVGVYRLRHTCPRFASAKAFVST